MKPIHEFLAELDQQQIRFKLDGDQLRIRAPQQALPPLVTDQLRLRKDEILHFLRRQPARQKVPALQAAERPAMLPLSYAQERLWFLAAMEGPSATYNVPLALRLRGALDPAALAAAINGVVHRHEVLRTSFPMVDGVAQQVISPNMTLALPLIDLSKEPEAERSIAVQRRLTEAAAQPFDLTAGPLLRSTLYRLTEQEHILLLTFHHIIADGWSLGIVLRELDALYRAALRGRASQPVLPPLPHQYADFALWQRQWLHGDRLQEQLSWWQQQLAAAPTLLDLPTDHARPAVQRFQGGTVNFTLDATLTTALEALSRRQGASLFMTLYAAFAVLLMRYSGQEDIVIGAPIANRHHRGLEPLIGFFVNTLPLRADLEGNPSFLELLQRVRQTTLDAYAHQDVPFEQVVNHLPIARSLSHSPLFQVMMTLDTTPEKTAAVAQPLGDLTATRVELENRIARFDLMLELVKIDNTLQGWFDYNCDLFEAETMTRMVRHLQTLLASIVADPNQSISSLPLLTETERHQILFEWNDTTVDYPKDKCIHQLFEEQVTRTPNAVAVVMAGEPIDENQVIDETIENRKSKIENRLTYAELNARANQLAHHLQTLGVGPDVLVGLCVERSIEMVVGLLGILKAGGAYVPLDPTYPPDRLAFMLADANTPILLTQAHLRDELPPIQAQIICLDSDWPSLAAADTRNPTSLVAARHLAYAIYTSGSTGKPKGALNAHRGVVNRLLWMQDAYALQADDRVLQKTPFSFDVSVWEFFWPLLTGAQMVIAKPEGHKDPDYLRAIIDQHQITTLHFVPSMLNAFLIAGSVEGEKMLCPAVRRVICSGEALSYDLQQRFFAQWGAELHNLYGPTEAAVDVSWWACQPESKHTVVPIGRPIANTQLYVLDPFRQPVPIGVPGELYIGGVQVGLGYLNRPELTAEKFISNPFAPGRLYKTGDLVRWLPGPEGAPNIEYLGRIDHQVKIRGFRIELGEIEVLLTQHPAVQTCAVLAREDAPGEKRLVAYVVSKSGSGDGKLETEGAVESHQSLVSTLRSYLQTTLPDYMIPSAFVRLDALPLSANGKVDRKALPAVDMTALTTDFAPAQTPTEKQLAAIWIKVLGIAQIGIHDNFFALGGDSILSIQVLAKAKQAGLNLSLQHLFQQQTIKALAATLDSQASPVPTALPPTLAFDLVTVSDRKDLLSAIDPNEVEDAYPLSALQSGMVFHSELAAGSAVYHDIFSYQLQAPFNLAAFQQAVQILTESHAVLRTSFALVNFTEPLQLVQRAVTVPINVVDLRGLSAEAQNDALDAWFTDEKQRPFVWQQAPLLRLQIHRRTDEQFNLTISFHHAILDGWSVATLLTELLQQYFACLQDDSPDNRVKPATLTVNFRDFVALERSALADDTNRRYWQTMLKDATVLKLPRWPQAQSTRSAENVGTWSVSFPAEVGAGLHQVARRAGVPIKSVLLAAHLNVLRVLGNQTDLLTGLASNGRPEVEQGERILGLFLNTLPFRLPLTGGTWLELVQQVFAQERQMLPHRRYPLASIQEESGNVALFEVIFNFVNFHVYDQLAEIPALTFLDGKYFEQTNYALVATFSLDAHNQISLDLTYDPGEFCAQQMAMFAGYYLKTLQAMSSQPSMPYNTFSLLTEAERHQLLVEWNDTATDYPKDKCIHHLFEEQVERTPEAVAVMFETQALTYRELNTRANQLAHHLQSLGVGPETLVGICVERSLEMVVGLLGILKAGGAYLPLDPAYPQERLAFMLQDADVSVLLTQAHLKAKLPPTKASILCLDHDWPQIATIATKDRSTPASEVQADNLAYVMYTSGSTGRPKGVSIMQRNVVRLVQNTNFARLTADEVFLQLAPISFDAATLEIWGPLLNGGRLAVMPAGQPSLEAIGNAIRQYGVTTLWLTAGLFHLMVDDHLEGLRPLRQLLAGGDVLSAPHVQRFLQTLPHCQLINGYGPTENTTFTCCYAFPTGASPGASAPIGRPIANTQVYILDERMQPAPVGIAGELYAGGDGVARGYFNRPDLTAEKFITNPFGAGRLYKTGDLVRWLPNGNIEFLGRIDQQVKLRGFRIELGEIEAVLGQHPAVQEAVVAAHKAENGEPRLVAYVVTNDKMSDPVILSGFRDYLRQKLPDYMIPSSFMAVDVLPLNSSGKVDRKALPAPEIQGTTSYARPRTLTEEKLAAIWREVLQVKDVTVGIHDSFFDLGGHSLLAVRLLAQIRQVFDRPLPLPILFQYPTVAALAAYLEEEEPLAWSTLVALQSQGEKRPFFCVPGAGGNVFYFYPLIRALGNRQPFYGLESVGLDGRVPPHRTVEEAAAYHLGELKRSFPQGPYLLGGHSFGGLVAFEMAQQLLRAGETVGALVLMDTHAPPTQRPPQNEVELILLYERLFSEEYGSPTMLSREELEPLSSRERLLRLQAVLEQIGALPAGNDLPEIQNLLHVYQTNYQTNYAPQNVIPLPIQLFVADEQPPEIRQQISDGWRQWGNVVVHSVPGSHTTMTYEPHVRTLAQKLAACLAATDGGDAGRAYSGFHRGAPVSSRAGTW